MVRIPNRFLLILCLLLACGAFPALRPAKAGLNPANPGLPRVDNVYGLSNIPGGNVSAMCVSCHTVVPVAGTSSHFVHQASRTTTSTNQQAKERTTAWNGSGALSKYGNFAPTPPVSMTTSGELICESCHNVITNVPGGNNLVEKSFMIDARPTQPNTLTGTTTTLCEGCHPASSLPAHHPMTGDTTSGGTALSNTDTTSVFTRVFIDNLTQMPSGSSTPSGVVYPGANKLICLSCHTNGHTGWNGTGARILRRGWAASTSTSPLVSGGAVIGAAAAGADRQYDKDPTGTVRIITNWQPLCDACHKVDD